MFQWINKQGVRSDDGIEVRFTGRFSAEIREGGRILKFPVEGGVSGGAPCINVTLDSFNEWEGGERVEAHTRKRLIDMLKAAMRFQGLELVVYEH